MSTETEPSLRSRRPDAWGAFRHAHLLLVMREAEQSGDATEPLTSERLAMYDFFAGHPYLLFGERGTAERRELVSAGIEHGSLIYASAPQRLSNRRQQMQADLAALLSRRLIDAQVADGFLTFALTGTGRHLADSMASLHAQAVRASAAIVLRKVGRMNPKRLRQEAQRASDDESLVIDVIGQD